MNCYNNNSIFIRRYSVVTRMKIVFYLKIGLLYRQKIYSIYKRLPKINNFSVKIFKFYNIILVFDKNNSFLCSKILQVIS
jgi:hypothetical protein